MKPASLFRPLVAILFLSVTGLAMAKSDSDNAGGPTPVLYTHAAHFSKKYDPNLKPEHLAMPLRLAPLIYPAKWQHWGQPAYAVVEYLVADTGFPREVQCTEATDRAFAKAVEKAVENSFFQPALKNQQGCYSKIVQRVEFTLPPPKGATPAAPATSATPAAPVAPEAK
jgi:hypothetical protein